MTFHIKTIGNNIDQIALAEVEAPFVVNEVEEEQADAFICRAQPFHNYTFSKKLLAIGRAGAGFNNIPIERCAQEGIVVFNAPGGNANAVKELVLGMMIFGTRNLEQANQWLRAQTGTDEEIDQRVEEAKKVFSGSELAGKTLGVIGLGNIGSRVANDARRLGMKVLGYDPYLSIEHAWNLSHHVKRVHQLTELLQKSDYITVHMPATPETQGLLNWANLSQCKRGVILLNYARDEISNKKDILRAIDAGIVKFFATDFGSECFNNCAQVFLTPHLGGSTKEAGLNCTRMALDSIQTYLQTGEIINAVNFPRVTQELLSPYRITLINKNVPNVVAQISMAVAKENINIANIVNRGQGDYAYTLLDLDEQDEEKIKALIERFSKADNVVRVRLIKNKRGM